MVRLYRLIYRSFPTAVFWPSILVLLIVAVFLIVFCRKKSYFSKLIYSCILVEYCFLTIWSTIIRRTESDGDSCKIIPYWNIKDLISFKDPLDYMEIGLNVILFMPIGFLLAGLLPKTNLRLIAIIGCCMSCIIELLQLLMNCGLCETNDVIHNTIGCILGACIFISIRRDRWYKPN